jgi:predicted sulfurtransferase
VSEYLNVSGYCFHNLTALPKLKEELLNRGLTLNLKGTVLIAPEGINVFLSAHPSAVREFLSVLCALTNTNFENFDFKFSWTDHPAFNRFLVRIKKEIIAFDQSYNFEHRAPYITPQDLEQRLNKEESIVLLDTRNDYETCLGKFKSAIDPGIKSFKEFKDAVQELEHLKDETIVTYCTGGIRCEKAAVYLKEQGFKNVFQLQGGILRYFEETPAAHYEGECFVFDKRVSVTTKLEPSDKKMCFACRMPLIEKDFTAPTYVEGHSCPHCYKGVIHAN